MIYQSLINSLDKITVQRNYRLAPLTKFGTGGNADVIVFPKTENELIKTLNLVKDYYPYFIIGGGSNLLISDDGFRGVIISTKYLTNVEIKGSLCIASCGAKIKNVVNETSNNCLSGLEFAVGIPATVGGAVAMNAGCYGKSIGDYVRYVVTDKGIFNNAECEFSYRKSRFLTNSETVIKVCFNCIPQEEDYIEDKIKQYKSFRKNPKGRNSGSVFKNDGYFAGKIIDEAGLKGYRIGDAKIAEEHANFIITESNATSKNVYDLINYIKKTVLEKKQINLSEEIIYLGEFK